MKEKELNEEEQAIINAVEIAIDYGLEINDDDLKRYYELTK